MYNTGPCIMHMFDVIGNQSIQLLGMFWACLPERGRNAPLIADADDILPGCTLMIHISHIS